MDKKTIDDIVWWIPIKKLRDAVREVLNTISNISQSNYSNIESIHNSISSLENKIRDLKEEDYKNTERLFINLQALSLTQSIHKETFAPFKNIHKGQDIVLVATGPSLKNFKPIKDAIYVGVNKAYQYDNVSLDYLFSHDKNALRGNLIDEVAKYKPDTCKKFFGTLPDNRSDKRFSEHDIQKVGGKIYMHLPHDGSSFINEPTYHIDKNLIYLNKSVVIDTMQFIFWTNPKRIYLAGCDCSNDGHFNSDKSNNLAIDCVIEGWNKIKKFRDTFYPDTEIISINPVGLKGIFEDIYTDEAIIDDFLIKNRGLRMDANRTDIWHPYRTEFHLDRYRFASKYIENKIVLDCASGLGYGADCLSKNGKPKKIYGVEINKQAVAYASKVYGGSNIEFRVGSILSLPFEDNFFDVFTSFETIEHIENEDKQLEEVKRVLKQGGYYILSTPNNWGLTEHHVKDYDYLSIKLLIEKYFTMEGIYNQNSESNRIMKRQIINTTEENYSEAECFIIVAVNNK